MNKDSVHGEHVLHGPSKRNKARAVEREYFPNVLSVVTQETEQSMPSIEEG